MGGSHEVGKMTVRFISPEAHRLLESPIRYIPSNAKLACYHCPRYVKSDAILDVSSSKMVIKWHNRDYLLGTLWKWIRI